MLSRITDGSNAVEALAQLVSHISEFINPANCLRLTSFILSVTDYLHRLYALCIVWDVTTDQTFNRTIDMVLKLLSTQNYVGKLSLITTTTQINGDTALQLNSEIENAINGGCQVKQTCMFR